MEKPKQKFPPLWTNPPLSSRRPMGGCGHCADVKKMLEDLDERAITSGCGSCQGDTPTDFTRDEREKS